MEAQRLFLAADLPHEEKIRLGQLQEAMRPLPGARWVPPRNLHVTLLFLGQTPAARQLDLGPAFRTAALDVPAGNVSISGTGGFSRPARASVLWAGLVEEQGTITELAAGVKRAAVGLGLPLGNKAFHAHVTLARLRPSADIRDLPPVPPGAPWRVQEIYLFSSRPGSSAPVYEAIDSYPLGSTFLKRC